MSDAPIATRSATRRLALAAAATAASVVMLGACAGAATQSEESNSATTEGAEGGDTGGTGAQVDIVDNDFEPSDVEVTAGVDVEWENTGDATHTVTFDDGEDSGNLDSGATYSRTFDESGEYPYVCSIHPEMAGTVTVAE